MSPQGTKEIKKMAIRIIILFGIISLLGDIIYEGARSVNGPYLKLLGVNATILGLIVGLGEFIGYIIRIVSGYFADKTRSYWFFTILGYSLLISIPLLALAGYWQVAALLIVIERIGKGLRSPARDTLVSYATKKVGTGFGFGLSEFLDQIGALLGPMIFVILLSSNTEKTIIDYQKAYSVFWIPFLILLAVLLITFFKFRMPVEFEEKENNSIENKKIFWLYSIFIFFTTFGFINFAIVGYHLKANNIVSDAQIPFLYAFAMIVDAFCGLLIGKIYDKMKIKNEKAGLLVLIILPVFSILAVLLVFLHNLLAIYVAMFIWGFVLGSHETIMKAVVADLTSVRKRGMAYGIFNAIYGFAIFLGSFISGYLYDFSVNYMIAALVSAEIISIVFFIILKKEI
ncbi:MAG: MFS transporter [Candidatus Aenigmatarchaeota archaeon]